MRNLFKTLSISLLLAGCAVSSGKQVNQAEVQQFETGKTTLSEVIAQLGEPNERTVNSDGSTSISYSFAKVSTNPFNPTSQIETSEFIFDNQQVLTSYSSSSAH
ncbi:hypothetical protein KHP62_14380 [Rhodobacteraceae bacterium NNCM2]|nr:hypothetical protein [Coraliihabitans acroporae]